MFKKSVDGTLYEVLGVHVDASPEAIRAAYRLAARQNHPDRFAHLGIVAYDEAEATMRRITEAWRVLSGEDRRRHYDLVIGVRLARCASCGNPGRLRLGSAGTAVGQCDACYRPPMMTTGYDS